MKKLIFTLVIAILSFSHVYGKSIETDIDGAALTVYIPDSVPVNKAVLILPGGGYSHLAMQHEGTDWTGWFNDRGVIAAVLAYPMPEGDCERPITSVARALAFMRDSVIAGDSIQLGIMGSSAGGHLASTAATHLPVQDRPDFQILFYPVITMEQSLTHAGSRDRLLGRNPGDDAVKRFSNHLRVDSDTPRAFIALSGDDGAVPPANSLQYFTALQANGVPASLHVYPTGGHGWGFRSKFKYHTPMLTELEAWLKSF